MDFKNFLSEIKSTRDYKQNSIARNLLSDIETYINSINGLTEKDANFSFRLYENGNELYEKLEGIGGYSGIMIKSPHYIGLLINDDNVKTEFLGAYYMQSIIKKLFDLSLGSCWVNIRKIDERIKNDIFKENTNINYLLAFGEIDEKALKQKTSSIHVQSGKTYKTDPYGAKILESLDIETCRLGVEEIVYLYEWEQNVTYEELENRGLADLFYYVRNAPSYKNKQPGRVILKDGEALIAIKNPSNKENITDGGILLFTIEGMAKAMGIPGKWVYVEQKSDKLTTKEYSVLAKIEL